jgi:hypothetical protein
VGGEGADSSWDGALLGRDTAVRKRQSRRRTGYREIWDLHEPGKVCTRETRFVCRAKKCIVKLK